MASSELSPRKLIHPRTAHSIMQDLSELSKGTESKSKVVGIVAEKHNISNTAVYNLLLSQAKIDAAMALYVDTERFKNALETYAAHGDIQQVSGMNAKTFAYWVLPYAENSDEIRTRRKLSRPKDGGGDALVEQENVMIFEDDPRIPVRVPRFKKTATVTGTKYAPFAGSIQYDV
jgi:hypothetical protein